MNFLITIRTLIIKMNSNTPQQTAEELFLDEIALTDGGNPYSIEEAIRKAKEKVLYQIQSAKSKLKDKDKQFWNEVEEYIQNNY